MSKPKSSELEVIHPGGASLPASLSTSLKERRDRIAAYHSSFMAAFAQQAGYAFLCGVELNGAKSDLPHGQFTAWCKESFPNLSNGSIHNFMSLAEALQAKFPTVGNLTSERLQLTDGRLREQDQKLILEAVHAAADGSSLTKLYRELGVIKTPTARESTSTPQDLTPEQAAAALEGVANDHFRNLISDLALITPEMRARASNALRAELIDAMITEGKSLRALKKQKPSRASGKKGKQ